GLPVRDTGPGAVLVHVGRTGPRRARRRRARGHPAAGRLLSVRRLLREAPRPVRRRGELLRRSAPLRAAGGPVRGRPRRRRPRRAVRRAPGDLGPAGSDRAGRARDSDDPAQRRTVRRSPRSLIFSPIAGSPIAGSPTCRGWTAPACPPGAWSAGAG